MSKYGNFQIPLPKEYLDECAALEEWKAKDLIDPQEYAEKKRNLKRDGLLYIVATNGGRTPKRASQRDVENLKEWRKRVDEQKTLQFSEMAKTERRQNKEKSETSVPLDTSNDSGSVTDLKEA